MPRKVGFEFVGTTFYYIGLQKGDEVICLEAYCDLYETGKSYTIVLQDGSPIVDGFCNGRSAKWRIVKLKEEEMVFDSYFDQQSYLKKGMLVQCIESTSRFYETGKVYVLQESYGCLFIKDEHGTDRNGFGGKWRVVQSEDVGVAEIYKPLRERISEVGCWIEVEGEKYQTFAHRGRVYGGYLLEFFGKEIKEIDPPFKDPFSKFERNEYWIREEEESITNFLNDYFSGLRKQFNYNYAAHFGCEAVGEQISYYPNKNAREKGQKVLSSPGKVFRKINPFLTDVELEKLVEKFKEQYFPEDFDVVVGYDSESFVAAYQNSSIQRAKDRNFDTSGYEKRLADSCMRNSSDFSNLEYHPCHIFGSGDWLVIYTQTKNGKIGGRCVVFTKYKGGMAPGPIYATSQQSIDLIKNKFKELSGEVYNACKQRSWDGAKVLHLMDGSDLIAPYLDKGDGFHLKSNGDLIITESLPCNASGGSYDGVQEWSDFCSSCGEETVWRDELCHECFHENHVECVITGVMIEEGSTVDIYRVNFDGEVQCYGPTSEYYRERYCQYVESHDKWFLNSYVTKVGDKYFFLIDEGVKWKHENGVNVLIEETQEEAA